MALDQLEVLFQGRSYVYDAADPLKEVLVYLHDHYVRNVEMDDAVQLKIRYQDELYEYLGVSYQKVREVFVWLGRRNVQSCVSRTHTSDNALVDMTKRKDVHEPSPQTGLVKLESDRLSTRRKRAPHRFR